MNEQALKDRQAEMLGELKNMGLEAERVWTPDPDAPARSEYRLIELLRWARVYRASGGRKAMERQGFLFPPVEPELNPDADWMRFERWMRGEPLDWNYTREYEPPPPVGHLQDSELDQAYARIVGRLAARGVVVKYLEPVPVRLRYEALRREVMETAFEYLPPRIHCVLNGCGGECIDCFQAPWCDLADIDDEPDEENL